MNRVTRTCRCPECGLPFFIRFDSDQRLGGVLERVACPRSIGGAGAPRDGESARCPGFIRTHVPDTYEVAAAERWPPASAPASPKGLSA